MSTVVIELEKENFKFSSGHFTIFSATERENMHGHNFNVGVRMTCTILGNGMTFDYGLAKRAVEQLCREWNEYFLLPGFSPFLKIEEQSGHINAHYNGEVIPFLARDVKVLPVSNVTVEELARLFLQRLKETFCERPEYAIHGISVRVYSGPGQCAEVTG
ncbi:MAG: 6-carboxytetrahydropterin synthase [Verrucomicrobia bacterium]|nr:6-carboxytetrahydropterin synthase [Verrucomicrobiota bacterium]